MANIKELYQSADWKQEKHVPVIEAPDSVKKGDSVAISAVVGKEIAHPNTSEHFIAWIELFFHPEGEKFPIQIGRYEFSSHGASAEGPNTSSVYSEAKITAVLKTEKSGTIIATSYCNIHGLWESSKSLKVE